MNLRFFPRLFYAIVCYTSRTGNKKRGPGDAGPRKLRGDRKTLRVGAGTRMWKEWDRDGI